MSTEFLSSSRPLLLSEKSATHGWRIRLSLSSPDDPKSLSYVHLRLRTSECHEQPGDCLEYGILCLGGLGVIHVGHKCFELRREDGAFIPSGVPFAVEADSEELNLALFSAIGQEGKEMAYLPLGQIREEDKILVSPGREDQEPPAVHHVLWGACRHGQASLSWGVTHGDSGTWSMWPPESPFFRQDRILLVQGLNGRHMAIQVIGGPGEGKETWPLVRAGDVLAIPSGHTAILHSPSSPATLIWASL